MEAIIFTGLQASGKSSFYRERFFDTHVRISLDLLRTRHRERRLLALCLELQQRFVVDNTNLTADARRPYVEAAKQAGFRVIGYYFQSQLEACLRRNEARPVSLAIPVRGNLERLQAA
jgi:predicted kinase